MRTTLSERGQTVVPAELRRRYEMQPGTELEWMDTGHGLLVLPVPADPVGALYGRGRGQGLLGKLLKERRLDRGLEGR
jgi:bifunctional DNA-binding transcriptional regulator/antitoxin component of YhaV-PrlF toxin-antitoxin module